MVRIEKIWNSKVNVIPLFFLVVSFKVALKAYGFVSVSIFLLLKQKQNLPSTLKFSLIFIQTPFWPCFLITFLPHLDRIRALFDHISDTSKVGGVVESFDDKTNTIFMNLECVLPEREKRIDK